MTAPDPVVVAALTSLRDSGLVTDRDQLNAAWSVLTGRTGNRSVTTVADPAVCVLCGQPGAIRWHEPAGRWHPECRPQLWKPPTGNPWATPRCTVCAQPAGYPAPRWRCTEPRCRDHAPERMRRYLAVEEPQ